PRGGGVGRARTVSRHEGRRDPAADRVTFPPAGQAPLAREFAGASERPNWGAGVSPPGGAVRNKLVPLNRRYPLAELFDALHYYAARTRHRITFEYVLLRGINDSAADAKLLRSLLGQLPAKLNLIVYNTTGEEYASATREDFIPFYERFLDAPFPVTFRENRGGDIDAACGQLWTRSVS
nr:hypothetical protein [bacterium]